MAICNLNEVFGDANEMSVHGIDARQLEQEVRQLKTACTLLTEDKAKWRSRAELMADCVRSSGERHILVGGEIRPGKVESGHTVMLSYAPGDGAPYNRHSVSGYANRTAGDVERLNTELFWQALDDLIDCNEEGHDT